MSGPPPEFTTDRLIGRLIGGMIELKTLLGAGAMGKVFRARHHGLDKDVAVKLLHTDDGTSSVDLVRFEKEARAASRLHHPNAVQVLDFGEDGDDRLVYIVMELVEGRDLRSILKDEGRFEVARACRIMGQVCSAVAAAHDCGIVHRDIKPTNVLLITQLNDDGDPEEFVKVCDFGLAKRFEASDDGPRSTDTTLTERGVLIGTPAYMSPEQVRGLPLDGRSDVYACGVVLYALVSGRRPFTGGPVEVAAAHLSVPPPPLSEHLPGVDPSLAAIVARALAKTRDERFPSARAMRQALKPFMDAAESPPRDPAEATAADAALSSMAIALRSRRPLLMAIALALGLMAGLALAVTRSYLSAEPDESARATPPVVIVAPAAPSAPSAPDRVRVVFPGAPPGAQVAGAEGPLGAAEAGIELLRGDAPVPLRLEAPGYRPRTIEVVPSADRSVEVKMGKRPRPKKRKSRNDLENPFK